MIEFMCLLGPKYIFEEAILIKFSFEFILQHSYFSLELLFASYFVGSLAGVRGVGDDCEYIF